MMFKQFWNYFFMFVIKKSKYEPVCYFGLVEISKLFIAVIEVLECCFYGF